MCPTELAALPASHSNSSVFHPSRASHTALIYSYFTSYKVRKTKLHFSNVDLSTTDHNDTATIISKVGECNNMVPSHEWDGPGWARVLVSSFWHNKHFCRPLSPGQSYAAYASGKPYFSNLGNLMINYAR
jgi:hypothetical protein